MDVDAALLAFDHDLQAAAVPERVEKERACLQSELVHYGVSMPAIQRVVKAFLKAHPALDRHMLLQFVERLWQPGVHELRMAAVELLAHRATLLAPEDVPLLKRLLRQARTWALVEPVAVQVVGVLAEAYPDTADVLGRRGRDEDHWLSRSALLAHLLPMRRGDLAVFERFARHADAMLEEREFFVRKAIGWVLREPAM